MDGLAIEPRAAIPAVGIYRDMPAAEYHALPLPSNSLLGHLARSPLHCRHAMDHSTRPTPEMALGTAFHSLVLEPARFAGRYVVAGTCSATKGKGDPCFNAGKVYAGGAWLCGVHAKGVGNEADPESVLSGDDAHALRSMERAVLSHPWAGATLSLDGMTEVSVVFDDPATGVRCKMRADRVVTDPRRRCVVDLKSTADASDDALRRSVHQRGYHRQAAMYLRGLAAVGIEVGGFALVAVERDAPHGVNAVEVDPDALAAGNDELDRLLATWAECQSSGRWPGYGDGVGTVGLPAWARRRDEQLIDVA